MNYSERLPLYTQIENLRRRPLLVYATSSRPGAEAAIAPDAVGEFENQLVKLPEGCKEIDLLIISKGGDGLTAWRIITMIRECLGEGCHIAALIPHEAFSAATLLALGANEIFMHPMACLGPVDPQVRVKTKDGMGMQFAYEDVVAFSDFVRSEGQIKSEKYVGPLLDNLFKEISPTVIGASKRASSLSAEIAKKLLCRHMSDQKKAQRIADSMNKSYFAHGHAVSRTEARGLGLNIAPDNPELSKLIRGVYESIAAEMRFREPFDAVMELLKSPDAAFLTDGNTIVNLPANTPPQYAANFWNHVLQQATNHIPLPAVERTLTFVVLESIQLATARRHTFKIIAHPPNLKFEVTTVFLKAGWEDVIIELGPERLRANQ